MPKPEEKLYQAIETLQICWQAWGESNYNVRDEAFQDVINAVSGVEAVYAALKDTGVITIEEELARR